MTGNAWLWAHLQTSLLFLAALGLLPQHLRSSPGGRALLAGIALAAAFLPLGALDPSAYVYAISGPLSLSGLALLLHWSLRRFSLGTLLPNSEYALLLSGLALFSLLFYPPSLGLGGFDPYGLGYTGLPPALLAGLLSALLWWQGLRRLALIPLLALGAWLLELGESHNLWDYLLDAWSALAALIWAGIAGVNRLGRRRRLQL